MKILFCTSSFKTGFGGIASYAHDFVRAFEKDNQFMVITNDDYKRTSESYAIEPLGMMDFSVVNAERLLRIIDCYKPDIIVNSNFPILSLITPFIADNIKVITVSHFTDGKLAWAAGMNSAYADAVITLSTYAKSYIENKFAVGDKSKVKIIYNYVDKPVSLSLAEKKSRKTLNIVYPGGCSYQKSAEVVCGVLIELLKTNLDFQFYWLGNTKIPGDKWPFVSTRRIEDCLPLPDKRIAHIGSVSRPKSQQILRDCNIFLLPSRGEGCPITLLEAMSGGCIPIISNARHGSLDIIENGKTGCVVTQNDVAETVGLIKDIVSNHEKYIYIYDNVQHKFNDELCYEPWLAKMRNVIDVPLQHTQRMSFDKQRFFSYARRMKHLLWGHWLKDRFLIQPYHMIYFRYLRYFKKSLP